MKTKLWLRMIAMLLSVILFVQLGTTIVFAEETPQETTAETTTKPTDDNPIIGEVVELRNANTKYFIHKDNRTYTAVKFSNNVHHFENGLWHETDNRLTDAADTTKLQTISDNLGLRFGKNSKGHILTIGKANKQIKFQLIDTNDASAEITNNQNLEDEFYPDHATSSVYYAQVFRQVDLKFDILGTTIKDNFILKDSSTTNTFKYLIQAGTNALTENDDGSISIVDQQGTLLYHLPAPYMYDDAGNISNLVEQSLERQGNNYTLTITADRDWLNSNERIYPVTIDPTINSQTEDMGVYIHSVESSSLAFVPFHTFTVGNYADNVVNRAYGYLWLPQLDSSEAGIGNAFYVQEAKLHLKAQSCDSTVSATLCLQEVTSPINDFDGMAWNEQPQCSDIIIDSYRKAANVDVTNDTISFDITSLVSKWYRGEPNNGFVLKSENETLTGSISFDGYEATNPPYVTITYRDLTGIDTDITTLEQSLGRAGSGAIQNATGALTYAFTDYDVTGERFPFSVSHVYNLANGNTNYGYGFNLNVASKVVPIDDDTIALVDASGHRTYYDFLSDNGKSGTSIQKYYVSEDDPNNIITYKYYKKYLYKVYTADDTDSNPANDDGSEVGQIDLYDATTGYLYESRDGQKNSSGSFMNIIYFTYNTAGQLTRIKDAVARNINLSYANGKLAQITYPDGSYNSYTYDENGCLIGVSKTKGTITQQIAAFTYITTNVCLYENEDWETYVPAEGESLAYQNTTIYRLNTVEDKIDHPGRKVEYEYCLNSESIGIYNAYTLPVLQVNRYRIFEGDIVFADYEMNYAYNSFMIIDNTKAEFPWEQHGLDQYGRTISAQNNDGYAQYYEYGAGSNGLLLSNSDVQYKNSKNLLQYFNFDTTTGWTTNNCTIVTQDSGALYGNYINIPTTSEITYAASALETGKTYVFSVYVKPQSATEGLVQIYADNNAGERQSTEFDASNLSNGWQRLELSFQATQQSMLLGVYNTANTPVYVDSAQLSVETTTSKFNLLQNNSFDFGISGYLQNETMSTDGVVALDDDDNEIVDTSSTVSNYAYKINGLSTAGKYIYQTVPISGSSGDTFVFGTNAKAKAVPEKDVEEDGTESTFSVTVKFSNATSSEFHTLPFNHYYDGWQYLCGEATAGIDYTSVTIYLKYKYNSNTAYFDDVVLRKELFGASYQYDSNDRLIAVVDSSGETTAVSYDSKGKVISVVSDGTLDSTNITEDNSGNELSTDDEYGISYQNTYANGGAITGSATLSSDSKKIIKSSTAYDSKNNYAVSQTDELGNTSSLIYDGNNAAITTGLLTKSTDASGMYYEYGYDGITRQLTSIAWYSSTGAYHNQNTMTYAGQNLSKITVEYETSATTKDSFDYDFEYDQYDQVTAIKRTVDNVAVTLRNYSYDDKHQLISEQFGNDANNRLHYSYDSAGNMVSVRTDEQTLYEYKYDEFGCLSATLDYVNDRKTVYAYNVNGELTGFYRDDGFSKSINESKSTISSVVYDKVQTIYEIPTNVNGTTTYRLSANDFLAESSGRFYKTQYNSAPTVSDTYDVLNRPYKSNINLSSLGYSHIYRTYVGTGGSGTTADPTKTSYVIDRLRLDLAGTNYVVQDHTYDALGNVTSINSTLDSRKTTYVYGDMGEISKKYVNDTTLSSQTYANALVGFSYDYNLANNLSTVTNKWSSSQTETRTFTYDDRYVDLLKSVTANGTTLSITYDDAGNMTTIGNKYIFAWEKGRNLQSTTLEDGKVVKYSYDDAGLRVSKEIYTSSSATVPMQSSYYYYDGGLLIAECQYVTNALGQQEISAFLGYFYDHNGNLLYLVYKEDFTNNVSCDTYMVYTNGVGEVEYLVHVLNCNSAGTKTYKFELAAQYVYSAYGEFVCNNLNGHTIGNENTMVYKGYVYDSDTGLYYLQSRYYSPYLCKFISMDDPMIITSNLSDPISTDLYEYCGNNPINCFDISGKKAKKDGWYEYSFTFSYVYTLLFLSGLSDRAISYSKTGRIDQFFYYIDRTLEVLNEVIPQSIYITFLCECIKGFVKSLNNAAYKELTTICRKSPSLKSIDKQMASLTVYMLDGCYGQQVKFVFRNYKWIITRTVKYKLHYTSFYTTYLNYIQRGFGFKCSRRRVGMHYKY